MCTALPQNHLRSCPIAGTRALITQVPGHRHVNPVIVISFANAWVRRAVKTCENTRKLVLYGFGDGAMVRWYRVPRYTKVLVTHFVPVVNTLFSVLQVLCVPYQDGKKKKREIKKG